MTGTREPLFGYDDPLIPNGESVGSDASPKSVRAYVMMPPSVVNRFKAIVVAERRTMSVVMQKCVEDFLSKSECEPRPYVPLNLNDEGRVKMYYTLSTQAVTSLKCRATNEGRDLAMILLRAMLDYCSASPDDPVKVDPDFGCEVERINISDESSSESKVSGGGSE